MKSLPFYISEDQIRYSFRAEPPLIGYRRECPHRNSITIWNSFNPTKFVKYWRIFLELNSKGLFVPYRSLGTGHYLSPGARWAKDLGLNKVKFSRFPLWMLLHWSDPPNNFWWLSRFLPPPPHIFIFKANLNGPPSEYFQSFQWFPVFGSQLLLIPPFVLPKIKWFPLESSASPPPRR